MEELDKTLDSMDVVSTDDASDALSDQTTILSPEASAASLGDETVVMPPTSSAPSLGDETVVMPSASSTAGLSDETVVISSEDAMQDATTVVDPDATVIVAPDQTVLAAASTSIPTAATDAGLADASAPAKHMRAALTSLPSFDFESEQGDEEANTSGDQAVLVTHENPEETMPIFPDASQDETDAEEQALSSLVADVSTVEDVSDDAVASVAEQQTAVAPLIEESVAAGEGVQAIESPITQDAAPGQPGNAKRIVKRVLIAGVAVAGVLGIAYCAGGFYFTSHFLPNTTVNGEDVSGMAVTDLSTYVSSIGDNYKAHVSGDGLDLTLNGPDIGFVYDGAAYSKQAADQIDPWRWPLNIANEHAYVVDEAISYDQTKLDEAVKAAIEAINKDATDPKNATMTYDEASSKFVVVSDELGTKINTDAVLPIVSNGVATMQTEIAVGEPELVQPSITTDDKKLNESIDNANHMLDTSIELRITNTNVTKIDRNLMASWFSLDDQSNIKVNRDAIKEWAQGPLSEQFDTVGTKRTYTRPDGKEIEVEGRSVDYDYGWCVDGEALADILAQNLSNINCDPIEIPMTRSGATWNPGGQDWPARYIDVDLSEQHVRMYNEASEVIWETDCVSGNPIYSGGTDTGVFFIYEKSSPRELVGLDYNGDGEPDYRTWVTYWMPFDGGEGLHDSQRYAFGGNIYTYNGSHGCVNLPYSAAQQLWEITNVGDPVIVHW